MQGYIMQGYIYIYFTYVKKFPEESNMDTPERRAAVKPNVLHYTKFAICRISRGVGGYLKKRRTLHLFKVVYSIPPLQDSTTALPLGSNTCKDQTNLLWKLYDKNIFI